MTNELIKTGTAQIGESEVNAVNAKSIYEYLNIKSNYTTWIIRAIEKYNFIENTDYIRTNLINSKNGINQKGAGRQEIKYIITLNMAKQLAMTSNTKKGQDIRNYFIDIENKYIAKQKAVINYHERVKKHLIGNLDLNEFKADTCIDLIKKYQSTKTEIKKAVLEAVDNKTTEQYKTLQTLFIESIKTQSQGRRNLEFKRQENDRIQKENEIKNEVCEFVDKIRGKIKRIEINPTEMLTNKSKFDKELEYNITQMRKIKRVAKSDFKHDVYHDIDIDEINEMLQDNTDKENIANFVLDTIKGKELVKVEL